MNLPLFIAGRYLFSKKSHSVINLISAVSAIGVAIGTAALIIILSVYNGFDGIIKGNLDDVDPDFRILPSEGKFFDPTVLDTLRGESRIASMDGILEEQVYVIYGEGQAVVRARGVDDGYGGYLLDGAKAVYSTSIARKLAVNPRSPLPFRLIYPDPDKRISMAAPSSSLLEEKVEPLAGIGLGRDEEADVMILPKSILERLLKTGGMASCAEVRVAEGLDGKEMASLKEWMGSALGPGFLVQDRMQQNETLYKMMRYEKAAIFLILVFVVIIVAFNVFGSLTMLMLEKKQDIGTLRSLGLRERDIRSAFLLEGWLISLLGMVSGLVAGCLLALLQQHSGLIRMPGNYLIGAYPVVIEWADVALTALAVSLIGLLVAVLPVAASRD